METNRSGATPGSEPAPFAEALASGWDGPLEGSQDRDQIERAVLDAALAPKGAAFSVAWLMIWNPRRERLEGWTVAGAPAESGAAAGPSVSEKTLDTERLRSWRGHSITPTRLDGAAGQAWSQGNAVVGDGGDVVMPWRGAAWVGAVPIRRGIGFYGLLIGEWSRVADDAERRCRLEAVGRSAARSFDRLDRAEEARRRSVRAASVAEFARASVSALNLAEALHLVARHAAQVTASRGSAVWRLRPETGLRLEVTHGPSGVRERIGRALQPLAASVCESVRPSVPTRVTSETLLAPDTAAQLSSLAILPITAYGEVLGALGVYDRAAPHPADRPEYDPVDIEFLSTLVDVFALVIDQAVRFEALRQAGLRCEALRARVRSEERLAVVGERASRAAAEARNPLASIGAFARRVHRELGETDPHREYLEIVVRETERLERIVGEPALQVPPEPAALALENVNTIVQDVLRETGEALVRRRVRLLKKLGPDLPTLLLDVARVRHVIANLLEHAVASVSVGGRIRIESRRVHPYVVVDVAHDGPRQAGDSLEQLFISFDSGTGEQPGLGLAAAQRIVHEHGGEIRVRSEPEWPSVLSFTLPIHDNQDRRLSRSERRGVRADRRSRSPER